MAKAEVIREGRHAVFAVDPGGTSGIAAGYVDLKSTLKETLLGIERRKAVEIEGAWKVQAHQIAEAMEKFQFGANVETGLSLDRIHFVFEDFVLRMPATTTNLTSIWVAAAAVILFGRDVTWQTASDAKSKATNERLKLWGLWEVGSEHKRDAWRHFALYVDRLMG